MSSTRRGSKRSPSDNYGTPSESLVSLLRHVNLPGGRWLECCAGDGALIRATNAMRDDVEWSAVEIRPECEPVLTDLVGKERLFIGDFNGIPYAVRSWKTKRYDVVITNPPFRIAREVIERSLQYGEWVVMLLRLNFLGSIERFNLFHYFMPDVYVLVNRPSFKGSKKNHTDSIEYMWTIWPPNRKRSWGTVSVLPPMLLEERRKYRIEDDYGSHGMEDKQDTHELPPEGGSRHQIDSDIRSLLGSVDDTASKVLEGTKDMEGASELVEDQQGSDECATEHAGLLGREQES